MKCRYFSDKENAGALVVEREREREREREKLQKAVYLAFDVQYVYEYYHT